MLISKTNSDNFLFAFILASVPSYHGYFLKGGALEVGKASTTSFVWTSVVIIITNYIRDKGAPKGTVHFSKKGKHNLNELLNKSKSWSGLLGLDLAKKVSCKNIYHWSSLKSWDKKKGYQKNKRNKYKATKISA